MEVQGPDYISRQPPGGRSSLCAVGNGRRGEERVPAGEMAEKLQVPPVCLCGHGGRASDVSTGSHQNPASNSGGSCVKTTRGRSSRAIPRDGAHGGWNRPGGRLVKAMAGGHASRVPAHRKAVIGGMTAGAIGQFFASPTDLVKVQMQMEGKRRLEGKPPRVRGVYHALVTIVSKGGVRGLWAGWVPNVQRAALVNMGDLTTYDTVKHFLLRNTNLKDNMLCHSISSIFSGLVAATLGTPADVIKTRIMNQPRDKNGRGILYRSSTDCFMQAVRGEGLMSLYKGFIPTWMRMAPWSLVFWLTYEQIRRLVGVSSF
uniref:Solute carrier family 25 member 27 n=1 Tax=Leptobrachium leishanense TaxID=445787 RepID=A0A8C5M8M3_9ANUR